MLLYAKPVVGSEFRARLKWPVHWSVWPQSVCMQQHWSACKHNKSKKGDDIAVGSARGQLDGGTMASSQCRLAHKACHKRSVCSHLTHFAPLPRHPSSFLRLISLTRARVRDWPQGIRDARLGSDQTALDASLSEPSTTGGPEVQEDAT